ncbi:YkvA family protein [Sphaerimonospora cavernae]|uniref:YkvA family protein n=1 Tax=Sphaerimonospora cavernae TaxID=1740611 RepID=A0ABV6U922_9ACTN
MAKAAKAGRAAATWRAYREVAQPGSPGIGSRIKALPRMIGAALRGHYPGLTKGKIAMFGAAVAYIISPIDAIPDFLLGIGVVDDFGVFLWLLTSLLGEGGRYVEWERQDPPPHPETT